MPSTATLSMRISHRNSILLSYFPVVTACPRNQSKVIRHMSAGHYQLTNMEATSWRAFRYCLWNVMFLSGTGGTRLKHRQHFPEVSLFKYILITNIHSKEHLQSTHRLQINKTNKAVSFYFKLSPHVSLRSAGMSEVLRCFLGWRVLIM
jgi:hypothetical protein